MRLRATEAHALDVTSAVAHDGEAHASARGHAHGKNAPAAFAQILGRHVATQDKTEAKAKAPTASTTSPRDRSVTSDGSLSATDLDAAAIAQDESESQQSMPAGDAPTLDSRAQVPPRTGAVKQHQRPTDPDSRDGHESPSSSLNTKAPHTATVSIEPVPPADAEATEKPEQTKGATASGAPVAQNSEPQASTTLHGAAKDSLLRRASSSTAEPETDGVAPGQDANAPADPPDEVSTVSAPDSALIAPPTIVVSAAPAPMPKAAATPAPLAAAAKTHEPLAPPPSGIANATEQKAAVQTPVTDSSMPKERESTSRAYSLYAGRPQPQPQPQPLTPAKTATEMPPEGIPAPESTEPAPDTGVLAKAKAIQASATPWSAPPRLADESTTPQPNAKPAVKAMSPHLAATVPSAFDSQTEQTPAEMTGTPAALQARSKASLVRTLEDAGATTASAPVTDAATPAPSANLAPAAVAPKNMVPQTFEPHAKAQTKPAEKPVKQNPLVSAGKPAQGTPSPTVAPATETATQSTETDSSDTKTATPVTETVPRSIELHVTEAAPHINETPVREPRALSQTHLRHSHSTPPNREPNLTSQSALPESPMPTEAESKAEPAPVAPAHATHAHKPAPHTSAPSHPSSTPVTATSNYHPSGTPAAVAIFPSHEAPISTAVTATENTAETVEPPHTTAKSATPTLTVPTAPIAGPKVVHKPASRATEAPAPSKTSDSLAPSAETPPKAQLPSPAIKHNASNPRTAAPPSAEQHQRPQTPAPAAPELQLSPNTPGVPATATTSTVSQKDSQTASPPPAAPARVPAVRQKLPVVAASDSVAAPAEEPHSPAALPLQHQTQPQAPSLPQSVPPAAKAPDTVAPRMGAPRTKSELRDFKKSIIETKAESDRETGTGGTEPATTSVHRIPEVAVGPTPAATGPTVEPRIKSTEQPLHTRDIAASSTQKAQQPTATPELLHHVAVHPTPSLPAQPTNAAGGAIATQTVMQTSVTETKDAPIAEQTAKLVDRAIDDPGLSVAVLPHVAHLSINSTNGDLALHVRVRDGNADVNVSGSMAPLFDSKAPEVRTALATEGLNLGSFATDQRGQSDHRHQPAEPAARADSRPTPSNPRHTASTGAAVDASDDHRIHVTA